MPDYIKVNPDGSTVYPYALQTLKTENKETSFPENIEEVASYFGVYPVQDTTRPEYNPLTHTLSLASPVQQNDAWVQVWQAVSLPLEAVRNNKLAQIDMEYRQQEAAGWDSGNGHLGFTPSDVALISGAFALAKEAAALGLPLPKLITLESTTLSFATIQEMTTLLLQYGAARATLSETYAARRKAVEQATTLEELQAISY